MTPHQAETAVTESDNYALCVVLKKGAVSKDSIRENARFVIDIGKKLHKKVAEVIGFEHT